MTKIPAVLCKRGAVGIAAAAFLLAGCHSQNPSAASLTAEPSTNAPAVPSRAGQGAPSPEKTPMTLSSKRSVAALAASAALLTGAAAPQAVRAADAPIWVTAYYPVWNQTGELTPDKIDYSALTHLVHFAIVPRPDGTIEDTIHGTMFAITPAQSQDVVTRGHKAGDKVLICLGGAGTGPLISPVIAPALRGTFIKNLIGFVQERGYDGIDVDMEPILPADEENFVAFVKDLRVALKAANPKYLLTFPASGEPGSQPKLCARLKDDFDQINIQTYDLSGTWDGFKTWYNGSLYGSKTLMTDTRPFPSASGKIALYTAAGVPAAKLGLGIAFYGFLWKGASGPGQSIQGVKTETVGYTDIMDKYYTPGAYHWDAAAHAPYLSLGGPGAKQFLSYDDARLTREKVLYARTHGLGGVIIWQLGSEYRPDQPAGKRSALLSAVKEAAHSPLKK